VGTIAQFDTIKGKFNVELKSTDAPKTVTNFENYVNRGAYKSSIIHRSATNPPVIQGGGYALSGTTLSQIATDAPVQAEIKLSNLRGTLAMARQASLDSATSQWYINTADDTALDTANGGYTVFGRVLGTGMSVVDSIAAIPVYDASAQLGGDFHELPLLNSTLAADNFVLVNNVQIVPLFQELARTRAALTLNGSINGGGVVEGDITASTLTLRPIGVGSATVTVSATDPNLNGAQTSFVVNVVAAPLFTAQPSSQNIAAGGTGTLNVAATGSATFQWQRNGAALSGVTSPTVNITNMQPAIAGLYTAVATSGAASVLSEPAILGVSSSEKIVGAGSTEVLHDQPHPNGNIFDQVLLGNAATTISADYTQNQITRTSYIDVDDDIVQVEFSGPGNLSILLDGGTGPAAPVNYNQPTVQYVKGHASIVVTGADERTNLLVFTVGRATAFDPTGAYNILQPVSSTNNPANNGSSLFVGHESTAYGGWANLARVSISSPSGKFGSLRLSNVIFQDTKGMTGVYAPGVAFQGPVYVGNINAIGTATPVFIIGSAVGETRITGGDLAQTNGQPVQINGITQLRYTAGQDSAGNIAPAQANNGILLQNGTNVTSQVVVNPQ
jgi:cyclophilin family peptidyl-prolyl cis-trans isomerase